MSSWLDRLPSNERRKIREKLRSPAEYEKLREKVKGPEDLEREMEWNEAMAELNFAIESEPKIKEALRDQIAEDISEQGIENLVENADALSPEQKAALEQGKFEISVEDELTVAPEGTVAEKIPVKRSVTDRYVTQLHS